MDTVNHIELTVTPSQVRPTLRALLHAIFFHRTLDNFEPDTFEISDNHIAAIPSSSREKEINGKIEEFIKTYLSSNAESGEIAVVLLQRRPRKGWFAVTEELVPWEEHLITLHFARSRGPNSTPPPNPLPGALLRLVTFCTEKNGNVPPLLGSSSETANLSHQIMIAPPPPSELFAPSPTIHPTRLTSPPPQPSLTTTPANVMRNDLVLPPSSAAVEANEARRTGFSGDGRRASSPGGMGGLGGNGTGAGAMAYFEQAKDGLRAVSARAGAVTGWGGRGNGRGT